MQGQKLPERRKQRGSRNSATHLFVRHYAMRRQPHCVGPYLDPHAGSGLAAPRGVDKLFDWLRNDGEAVVAQPTQQWDARRVLLPHRGIEESPQNGCPALKLGKEFSVIDVEAKRFRGKMKGWRRE